MLILSRKIDESIVIGENIEVSIVDIKGDQVKLGIKAPKDVKVYRQEVFTAIQNENKAAAQTGTQLPKIDFFDRDKAGKKSKKSGNSGGASSAGSRSAADSSGSSREEDR
jgi:carbon storage regulator